MAPPPPEMFLEYSALIVTEKAFYPLLVQSCSDPVIVSGEIVSLGNGRQQGREAWFSCALLEPSEQYTSANAKASMRYHPENGFLDRARTDVIFVILCVKIVHSLEIHCRLALSEFIPRR